LVIAGFIGALNMKVLLCEDIETLGWYGDIIDVNEGYARNYLLPQRIAIVPSEAKIKAMAQEKAKRAEQRQVVIDNLKKAAQAVNGAEAVIAAKANEQGHRLQKVRLQRIFACRDTKLPTSTSNLVSISKRSANIRSKLSLQWI
jgi:ribosomal protein L9